MRVARANYADGIAKPVSGPPSRYVSNRIFNDVHQNLFSENGVTQWGFVWGQFMDHTFGLRQEDGGENAPIAFNKTDPLESFTNTLGSIMFSRTPAAPGTGTGTTPRQQINTVSSYMDSFSVYGGTADGSNGSARGRSMAGSRTTGRSCCCRTASCLARISGVTPQQRRRWR